MNDYTTFAHIGNGYRRKSGIVALLLGLLVILTPLHLQASSLLPFPTSPAVQEVRSLYPSEWGVYYVRGVAYSTSLEHLYLTDAVQPIAGKTRVVTLTPYEEWISTVDLDFVMDDVINITFDERNRRLLLFDSTRDELAEVSLGSDNRLTPDSLIRKEVSAWNVTKAEGIAIDKAGNYLYILDSGASRIVRITRNATGAFADSSTVTTINLAYFGVPLHGLAVHPATGHLYVGGPFAGVVYELTLRGLIIQAHSLWSFALDNPSGIVFIPSADRTDAPNIVHLLIANSRPPTTLTASSDDEPDSAEHQLYLPLVQTQTATSAVADAAAESATSARIRYGELLTVALCTPNCGNLIWTVVRQVSDGNDDAEERLPTGDMSRIASSDLELIRDGEIDQWIGVRFRNLTVPQGATILYAAIEFETDAAGSVQTELRFRADDSDDAASFQDTPFNISSRVKTGASISWNVPAWDWVNDRYRTPNLASVVQEIVNRAGWKNGNALAFIINGTGQRTAESYEGEPAAAPKLYLAYTTQQIMAQPMVETSPMPDSGDAADDLAIWVHPTDPGLSTIIGANKQGGLAVYDLSGRQLQYLTDHKVNNVDLRQTFSLNGERIALVTASSPIDDHIVLYRVNPVTRLLENIAARPLLSSLPLEAGVCMYLSPRSGKHYLILTDQSLGNVEQWELFDNGAGAVDAALVRTFSVGFQTEGCVADDELGVLYIASEEVGIWKYSAEPDADTTRTLIDSVNGGHLTADVEGLTIYYAGNGDGYLIASSQGSNRFVVYQRAGNNEYVTTFGIEASSTIDRVTHTDGIDVTNAPLGPAFPFGVFVAQDDKNDGANQNFKLVPWESIAFAATPPLIIDPLRKP